MNLTLKVAAGLEAQVAEVSVGVKVAVLLVVEELVAAKVETGVVASLLEHRLKGVRK